jgi:hypothetical protein
MPRLVMQLTQTSDEQLIETVDNNIGTSRKPKLLEAGSWTMRSTSVPTGHSRINTGAWGCAEVQTFGVSVYTSIHHHFHESDTRDHNHTCDRLVDCWSVLYKKKIKNHRPVRCTL